MSRLYSPCYQYAHIRSQCPSVTFSTSAVEAVLSLQPSLRSKGNGAYASPCGHLQLQILKVRSPDSWNSNDYDAAAANYIDLVVSRTHWDRFLPLLLQLADLLQLPLRIEDSEDHAEQ